MVNRQSWVGDVQLSLLWVSWLECSCYFSLWNKMTGNVFKESFIFTSSPGIEINSVHRKENLQRFAVSWKDHFLFDSYSAECLKRDFMVMCSLLIFFWIQMHEDQRIEFNFWTPSKVLEAGQKESGIINWQNFMYHEIVSVCHLLSSTSVLKWRWGME